MPSSSSTQQNKAIAAVQQVTQLDKTRATALLKEYGWKTDFAINAFLNDPSKGASPAARDALNKFFDKLRDDPRESPDEINVEGTMQLLQNISVDMEDIAALILSELVQSPSLGVIARAGFVDGCLNAGVKDQRDLQNAIQHRRSTISKDEKLFERVYIQTFQLALAPGSKILPLEMAQSFWQVLFRQPGYSWTTKTTPWLDWWNAYLDEKFVQRDEAGDVIKVNKAVNRDLWKQTLKFAKETIKDDRLAFWTEESSWPSDIDGFVAWVKEKRERDNDAMATD